MGSYTPRTHASLRMVVGVDAESGHPSCDRTSRWCSEGYKISLPCLSRSLFFFVLSWSFLQEKRLLCSLFSVFPIEHSLLFQTNRERKESGEKGTNIYMWTSLWHSLFFAFNRVHGFVLSNLSYSSCVHTFSYCILIRNHMYVKKIWSFCYYVPSTPKYMYILQKLCSHAYSILSIHVLHIHTPTLIFHIYSK